MIVPDTNLLIYAHDKTATAHQAARKWWEHSLSCTEPVGLPWVVILAFVRLMTHPSLSENPMTVEEAQECVESWLNQPNCRVLPSQSTTVKRFFDLLRQAGMGGNLCTDAMIAAVAEEYGGTVYSNDRDFDRFANITWKNPLP